MFIVRFAKAIHLDTQLNGGNGVAYLEARRRSFSSSSSSSKAAQRSVLRLTCASHIVLQESADKLQTPFGLQNDRATVVCQRRRPCAWLLPSMRRWQAAANHFSSRACCRTFAMAISVGDTSTHCGYSLRCWLQLGSVETVDLINKQQHTSCGSRRLIRHRCQIAATALPAFRTKSVNKINAHFIGGVTILAKAA